MKRHTGAQQCPRCGVTYAPACHGQVERAHCFGVGLLFLRGVQIGLSMNPNAPKQQSCKSYELYAAPPPVSALEFDEEAMKVLLATPSQAAALVVERHLQVQVMGAAQMRLESRRLHG